MTSEKRIGSYIPHSMVVDAHSEMIVSYLAGGDEIVILIKI